MVADQASGKTTQNKNSTPTGEAGIHLTFSIVSGERARTLEKATPLILSSQCLPETEVQSEPQEVFHSPIPSIPHITK